MFDFFSAFSDVSKYRDPLHILLAHIAEVSSTGLVSCLSYPQYANLNVNYVASI